MVEELGRPVSIGEVFIRTHTKPDGSYVDLKSEQVIEAYKKNLELKFSQLEEDDSGTLEETSPTPKISTDEENYIFLQSTLIDSKGRPYGLGSLEETLLNRKRKHSESFSTLLNGLQQQLLEAKQLLEEQAASNALRDSQIAAREAELTELRLSNKKKIDHLSMVERYLRATDPRFLDFVSSNSVPTNVTPESLE